MMGKIVVMILAIVSVWLLSFSEVQPSRYDTYEEYLVAQMGPYITELEERLEFAFPAPPGETENQGRPLYQVLQPGSEICAGEGARWLALSDHPYVIQFVNTGTGSAEFIWAPVEDSPHPLGNETLSMMRLMTIDTGGEWHVFNDLPRPGRICLWSATDRPLTIALWVYQVV